MQPAKQEQFAKFQPFFNFLKPKSHINGDLICTMKNMLRWFRLNSLKFNLKKFKFSLLGDKTCYEHGLKINLCSG